ncbi:MAG: hypothetical protein ACXACG_09210 [Candidatus Thorarchaeota archaeon]|jgi:hypothetical protein
MKSQTKLIGIGAVFMILLSTTIILAIYGDMDGPLVYQIDILPVDPIVGSDITVTVYAIDPSGVSKVHLNYTTDGLNWEVQDMDFFACLCAAGGRWVGTFGPISDESITEFYVTAYDNSLTLNPSDSQIFSLETDT